MVQDGKPLEDKTVIEDRDQTAAATSNKKHRKIKRSLPFLTYLKLTLFIHE